MSRHLRTDDVRALAIQMRQCFVKKGLRTLEIVAWNTLENLLLVGTNEEQDEKWLREYEERLAQEERSYSFGIETVQPCSGCAFFQHGTSHCQRHQITVVSPDYSTCDGWWPKGGDK